MGDILFVDAYHKLRMDDRKLQLSNTLVQALMGKCINAEWMISLSVVMGDSPAQINQMVDFLVIDKISSYKAIIRRPTLSAIWQ